MDCKICSNIPEYPRRNVLDDTLGVSIYDNKISLISDTSDMLVQSTNHIPISFCPICGRKLVPSKIEIYTDGALKTSTKTGGWAFVVVDNGSIIYKKYDKKDNTTNNVMELVAVIKSLIYIRKNQLEDVTILTDSQYVYGCATLGWKRKSNLKYWEIFDKLINGLDISIQWVKGHSNNKYNQQADTLAVFASNLLDSIK